jgi:hypothetical protein
MLRQRMNYLLLGVIVVAVVILSSFLVFGFDRLTAQAQGENPNADLAQSLARTEGQVEAINDASPIGPQSTTSGAEYIPPSAIRHDGVSPASGYRFWLYEGYIRNNSTSLMCLSAPVYVPHGATITQFSMFFVDDHATSDMEARLFRRRHAFPPDTSSELMANMYFPGIDAPTHWIGWTTAIQPGTETVSYDYGYYVAFCFDPDTGLDQRVYGFRVDYTP